MLDMKIGIIGMGMVGKAIYDGLKKIGNEMVFYDVKFNGSSINDVLDTEVVYVCVPTLPDENNRCDISIVKVVIGQLEKLGYGGIICIKSTVTPGTTDALIDQYKGVKICFSPEFLKERCAFEDFYLNNQICIVGTHDEGVFDVVKRSHGSIPKSFKMTSPKEAELTKYFQNVYNTCRVIFANGFYEVCSKNGVNYDSIVQSLVVRKEMDEKYLKCNDKLRGPSGPCLVKDSLSFNEYVKSLDLPAMPSIFQAIVDDMKLYPKTVIEGTRDELTYFGKLIG